MQWNRSLILRHWFRNLCTFYKIKTTGVSQHLSDLIPRANHLQKTCVAEDVTTFYSRTDIFKYFFLQYTVLERNKLDWNIQQSKTMVSFRNSLLKTCWHIPKSIYNIHNPIDLTVLNRLRLGPSNLNQDKFNCKFRDCVNPLYHCSLESESLFYFFLHCHYFTDILKTSFNELLLVDESTLNQSENKIVKLILYGNQKFKFQQNCKIFY